MDQAIGWVQWITLIEIPALAALAGLLLHWRSKFSEALDELRRGGESAHDRLRAETAAVAAALADYKLTVSKEYVAVGYLRDVEKRLTEHLVRIEAKLDAAPRSSPRRSGG